MEGEEGESVDEVKQSAAVWVTALFKIAIAKRRAAKKATKRYEKYWDPTWAAAYYFNPLTTASFWEKPKLLRDEDLEFADVGSAVAAADAEIAAKLAAAEPGAGMDMEDIKNAKMPEAERLALMKKRNPKAGEPPLMQPSKADCLRASMAVYGMEVQLVQLRCKAMEAPFRMQYRWDGPRPDEEFALRVFVFDREVPGTTKFELRTATGPDRGGLLSTFSRNRPVADFLTWPLGLEFYSYFASRPGTTLFTVSYSHTPFRSIITTSTSVGAVWNRHFTFHGYEGALFYVRESPEGGRYCVALQHTMLEWSECFTFVGFVKAVPGAIKINVLERHDPEHRFKISPAAVASRSGWNLLFSFYAFDVPMPGTTKFAVQQRRDPDECRVYRKMALPPWKDTFVFYAYDP